MITINGIVSALVLCVVATLCVLSVRKKTTDRRNRLESLKEAERRATPKRDAS